MSAAVVAPKKQKATVLPINVMYRFLQAKSRVRIWLVEHTDMYMEGVLIGFDEFMNVVLDNANEVNTKKQSTKKIGRMMLKGDNITLVSLADPVAAEPAPMRE